ncbi:MAG: InlB B-repeat-containing protein, partial [Eubacterium sp.]
MKKVCSVILAVIIMIGFSSGLNYKAYADDLNEADSIVVNKEKAPFMPTSDVKYYKFIPEISSYYKIYFNPLNSSSLTLYDGSYNVLDSYNGNEAYEKFMYFNAGLTYFFQVNCKSGTVLPYRLKLLNAYNIYFNGNGGIPDYSSKLISKGDKYGELPQAKRPKYVFDGWYTDPTNGKEITAKTEHTIEDSITVYAHWIPRPVVYCDGREVEEFDISAGSGVFSIADSSGLINATWTSSDVSVISVVKKTGSYTVTGLGNAVVTASYTKNNKSYKIDTVIHSKTFANSVNTITPHQTEY